MSKNIELLAPVGKMESLYAAVQNGADAVYLGGKLFNARKYASNFSNEELVEAVKYAHLRGVRVYVTVNILIDDSEMEAALDYIKYLYEIDIDGIIIQDIGLANLVSKLIPGMEIHASTQMTINNLEGAKFLYENGFTRVVLARETPIEEIKYISERSPIELEVFIHGALCVSYSGQCLMSSMIGGRSGNRGSCAQPCRMPSSIVDENGKLVEGWSKKHILSPKDLNTLSEIEKLVDAGVVSYKIEGRMKRPEYVATVVSAYREALDFGYSKIKKSTLDDVEQIFNRGFTKGLTFNDFARDFISYDRPNNQGVYLGKVEYLGKDQVIIQLEENLEHGDGIEFQLGIDNYKGMRINDIGVRGDNYSLPRLSGVKVGDKVYKTSSSSLLEKAKESYKEENIKYDIYFKFIAKLGEYPELEVKFNGKEINVVGEKFIEKSKNLPLDNNTIIEQLSKLGDTVYNLKEIDITLDDNCFMPLSYLNKLRREAIKKLNEERLLRSKKDDFKLRDYKKNKEELLRTNVQSFNRPPKLSVRVENYEEFLRLDLEELDRVYIGFYKDENLYKALDILSSYPDVEIYISTEEILYSKDINLLVSILNKIEKDIDGVSVSNLGTFYLISKNYSLKIHADTSMNLFNSYSVNFLANLGLDSANLSLELNLNQVKKIVKKSNISISHLIYGYIPVMVTKHCPMSLVKNCDDDSNCEKCKFNKGYSIKDRMNVEFKFKRKLSYSYIYNSVPLMLLEDIKDFEDIESGEFRIDFNFDDEEVEKIQNVYYETINGKSSKNKINEFISNYRSINDITKGHYYRGIMD